MFENTKRALFGELYNGASAAISGAGQLAQGYVNNASYTAVKDQAKSTINDAIGTPQQVQDLVKTTLAGTPDSTGAKVDPTAPPQAQPKPSPTAPAKQMLSQDIKNQTINNLPKGLMHLAKGEYGQYAGHMGSQLMDWAGFGAKTAGWWDTAKNVGSAGWHGVKAVAGVTAAPIMQMFNPAGGYAALSSAKDNAAKAYDSGAKALSSGFENVKTTLQPAIDARKQEVGTNIAQGLVGSPLMQTAGKQIASGITDGILGQSGIASEYGGSFGRAMAHGAIGDFKGMMGVITGPADQPTPGQPVGPAQQPK